MKKLTLNELLELEKERELLAGHKKGDERSSTRKEGAGTSTFSEITTQSKCMQDSKPQ